MTVAGYMQAITGPLLTRTWTVRQAEGKKYEPCQWELNIDAAERSFLLSDLATDQLAQEGLVQLDLLGRPDHPRPTRARKLVLRQMKSLVELPLEKPLKPLTLLKPVPAEVLRRAPQSTYANQGRQSPGLGCRPDERSVAGYLHVKLGHLA